MVNSEAGRFRNLHSGNTNVLEQMEPVCVGIFIHGDKVHLKILELSMEFYRHEYWSGLPVPSSEIFLTEELNHIIG